MEELKEFLHTIGFGKTESEVYVALIKLGEATVLEISRETGLHRPNIYGALDNLIREGLVSKIDKPKNLFLARNPIKVLNYLKRKEISLDSMLKEIDNKYPLKKHTSIGSFQGIFAAREAILSFLESNEPIYVYGIPRTASEILGPMIYKFHRERIKKKIQMKHIYNPDARQRIKYLNKRRFTEARAFPFKYNSHVSTNICGDKVVFILWNDDINVVEIQNIELAEQQKKVFEAIWTKANSLDRKPNAQ